MPRRKNQNLTPDETRALQQIAAYHGYLQPRGPGRGQGSILALTLRLVAGDVATTSIDPDDRQALAAWLREQTPPAHLAELVQDLVDDLVWGLARSAPADAASGAETGPLNTLEG